MRKPPRTFTLKVKRNQGEGRGREGIATPEHLSSRSACVHSPAPHRKRGTPAPKTWPFLVQSPHQFSLDDLSAMDTQHRVTISPVFSPSDPTVFLQRLARILSDFKPGSGGIELGIKQRLSRCWGSLECSLSHALLPWACVISLLFLPAPAVAFADVSAF